MMAVERGAHTRAEILSQPEVWNEALRAARESSAAAQALWASGQFDRVLFTGCGSTHYLAATAAALFQRASGVPARAYPASEIALFPELVFAPGGRPLLVTVSRSGTTTETVAAARLFRERTGAPVVAITCQSDSTLAREADLSIPIDAAQETSLAQTRSFASMTIVAQAFAALAAGADVEAQASLPAVARRLLTDRHDLARALGENSAIERFFFLGSGPLYGMACEGMLKMKEMSISYSEAYHTLEFRHGPMSMVDDRSLVVGLISDEAAPQETAVLRQMRERGARVLALAEGDPALQAGEHVQTVALRTGAPAWARPVAYLPLLQLMAYYRAMSRGQNPDAPTNVSFVISLDASLT